MGNKDSFLALGWETGFYIFCFLLFYREFPTPLEYFGYLFHFSSFLVGPTYTYREYIDFIEGKDIERALADPKVLF